MAKKSKEKTTKTNTTRNKTTNKKTGKISFFMYLIVLSLIPLLLSISILSIVSIGVIRTQLSNGAKNTLTLISGNLATYCEDNGITAMNASGYYDYLDSLKDKGYEMAIIADGIPCTTSIKNENDYRIREIELTNDEKKLAEGYYQKNIAIEGVVYSGYYTPITQDGKIKAYALACQPKKDITKVSNILMAVFMVLSIILLVSCGLIVLITSRTLMRSLKTADHNINELASGNLKKQSSSKSSISEISNLLYATDALQTNLNTTIGNVQNVSEILTSNIKEVTELSKTSAHHAEDINSYIINMSQSSSSMDENVQDITDQMNNIETCVNDIAISVDQLYEHSNILLQTNNESSDNMKHIIESSQKSAQAVQDISTQIINTNKSISEIDQAVELILAISGQTKLLSLNASIEAARAGEAGRGFSVVAEEIRNLSQQSEEGAAMIRALASTIAEESGKSVELVKTLNTLIKTELESIEDTQNKFEEHSEKIQMSVSEIHTIANQTENLTNSKNQVVANIQTLSVLSEENSANSKEVTSRVSEIINGVKSVNDLCDSINGKAVNLQESVDFFHE